MYTDLPKTEVDTNLRDEKYDSIVGGTIHFKIRRATTRKLEARTEACGAIFMTISSENTHSLCKKNKDQIPVPPGSHPLLATNPLALSHTQQPEQGCHLVPPFEMSTGFHQDICYLTQITCYLTRATHLLCCPSSPPSVLPLFTTFCAAPLHHLLCCPSSPTFHLLSLDRLGVAPSHRLCLLDFPLKCNQHPLRCNQQPPAHCLRRTPHPLSPPPKPSSLISSRHHRSKSTLAAANPRTPHQVCHHPTQIKA